MTNPQSPLPSSDERAKPEPAPPNNLPDWGECGLRVDNSNFFAKQVAEGGYGPESDAKLASELHRFIYEYDDADPRRSAWFLHRLEKLLDETRRSAITTTTAPENVREAVARAIWNLRRVEEDRYDMELEDMGEDHPVWDQADAAISAMSTPPTSAGKESGT